MSSVSDPSQSTQQPVPVAELGSARTTGTFQFSSSQIIVLLLVCTLSMITYLDRVCFGVAAGSIAAELGLKGVSELKWAFTAFSIAYALFEIPTGWWGDRIGPRAMLIRIVIWWSACTALTGMIGWQYGGWTFGGLGTLIVLRFLFGAGEAGAYPNIAKAIYNWFPSHQWESAQGFVWMSGRLMGGLTPLIWALLVTGTSFSTPLVSCRGAFLIFAGSGLVWCIAFWSLFQNLPKNSDRNLSVESSTKSAQGHRVPWKWLFTNSELLVLCCVYSLLNYGWAFNISYLPSYVANRFPMEEFADLRPIYLGAPLWVGAIGCLCGGPLVSLLDRYIHNRRLSRCVLGVFSMLGCAISWGLATQADNMHLFCISVAMAAFFVDITLGATWATCQDIGQEHTAVAGGFMNTIGTIGAAVAVWTTGTIVEVAISARATIENVVPDLLTDEIRLQASLDGYQSVFTTYAAVYLLAAIGWGVIGWVQLRNRRAEAA
ncbi:MFS transporter [Planctomicrobium sp. SH668]|uniref:MFS transporter n=1 Tax=Planctomicrobium sp. SH668 TaxID=3448126 RepID=UPI003F5B7A2A